jgi:opacity protein-like surface antigen
MYRTILCAAAGAAIFAMPSKAAEVVEPVRLPDGIYVLNMAKSVIHGAGPVAEMFKLENNKSIVIGFNNAGEQVNFSFDQVAFDGKSHPITGSPAWDSYTATYLDPYTTSETRFKDGQARLTSVTILNQKTNTITTTIISLRGLATNLLVFEKQ